MPKDPGAADPGTANYCARAVTFRSEEVTLQVEDQPDGCSFLPILENGRSREQAAGMTPENAASEVVQPAELTAENAALAFEHAYRGAGPG